MSKALAPVPKVYLPAAVGAIAILVRWIATGDFDRVEVGAVVSLALYAVIGYAAPRA